MYANRMKNNFISAIGAFVCIFILATLNSYYEGNFWLIPPFGASMVLVMAVHESPLAHPKNILFGHILSALSGVVVFADGSSACWSKSYYCCNGSKRFKFRFNTSCSWSIFYNFICNYL